MLPMVSLFKRLSRPPFEELVEKEKDKLYRVAFTYVRNEHDALDVVQEAVVKGYEAYDRIKHLDYFSSWMTRIVINTAIDLLRKRKDVIPFCPEKSQMNGWTETHIISRLDLFDVLSELKPEETTLLVLRYYHDFTILEIARFMNKPEGTIKAQLHRTLAKVRKRMEKGGDTYEQLWS